MKIRKLTSENYFKVSALLKQAFPGSNYEVQLVENLHENDISLYEWVCIHRNRIIAYIAFSTAFCNDKKCGLHLAPLAVNPKFQRQGVGSELLRFALRQDIIKATTLFVLGDPKFYKRFDFEHCKIPLCPFDENNDHFLSIRNDISSRSTVGYEDEFYIDS